MSVRTSLKPTDHHDQIDLLRLFKEFLDVLDHALGQSLAKPHNTRAKQTGLARRALRQIVVAKCGNRYRFVLDVELAARSRIRLLSGYGERGDNGIGEVVALDVVAEEARAFDVVERAVEEFELFGWVVGSWGEALL
jgi:hypothetical protein